MSIVKRKDSGITLEDSIKYIGDNFISRLPLFKYEKTSIPENNVCLFIDLLSDGTGDFGWTKEYIDLLLEYGYTKDKIFIFGLVSKVFNDDGSLSEEFREIEDTIKNTLQAVMRLDDIDEKKDILNTILNKFNDLCDFFSKTKEIDSSKISIFIGDFVKENLDVIKKINEGKNSLSNIIDDLEEKIKVYEAFCEDITTKSHPLCNLAIPEFTRSLIFLKNRIFLFISRVIKNIENFNDANFYYAGKEYIENKLRMTLENKKIIDCNDKVLGKILENSVVFYFSASKTLNIMLPFENINGVDNGKINLRKCNKIKSFIIMAEGGLGYYKSDITENYYLSSGIGERQMGINLQNIDKLPTKREIIEKLKTHVYPDFQKYLNLDTKFHYAYIGQLNIQNMQNLHITSQQICKYLYDQVLLLNLIDNNTKDTPNFLFALENIKQYIHNLKNYGLYFNIIKKLKIEDIDGNNEEEITNLIYSFFKKYNIQIEDFNYKNLTYKLTSEDKNKHLIVSYFPRLDKNYFLSMVKYSTSPVFSTGDLSTQEALALGKYVIADYIDNKIHMIDLFIKTLNKFCNSKNAELYLPVENHIDFYRKIDDRIFNLRNDDIILSISSFKTHIDNFNLFKSEILDKYFLFRDNFKVLLYLANICIRDDGNTLYLPIQYSPNDDEIIEEMNNEGDLKKYLDGLLGGKNNYYLKYQKYKLKYFKLKNSYK